MALILLVLLNARRALVGWDCKRKATERRTEKAKKEHKPKKSNKQAYWERKAAGICVSCAKFKATKDSVECQVFKSNSTK